MVYKFPTNADFDSRVSSSKPKTVNWISDYADHCFKEGLPIHYGNSVKSFLVYRHETPKVAKRSNKERRLGIQQRFQAILHLVV
jgi:hypothetical protein